MLQPLGDVSNVSGTHGPCSAMSSSTQARTDDDRREAAVGQPTWKSHGIEEALTALKPGPPGIEIGSKYFRPATFIELSIDNLTQALTIGCILVVIVLSAFLYEWRVALISVVAIPCRWVAPAWFFI